MYSIFINSVYMYTCKKKLCNLLRIRRFKENLNNFEVQEVTFDAKSTFSDS